MRKLFFYILFLSSCTASSLSLSKELAATPAHMFIAILSNHLTYPQHNAVESYANAFDMKEAPENMLEMFNAEKAYFAKSINGFVLISYNEHSPIAIALDKNFKSDEIISELSQFLKLKHKGETTQLGQKTELKEMFDGGKSIGFLFISYGIADPIKGTGSIAYLNKLPKL